MTTLRARDKGTFALPEGQVLVVTGFAGCSGSVRRVDPAIGGLNYVDTWAVVDGVLPQVGPYAGDQQFLVTCLAGRIHAVMQGAVVSVPQIIVSSAAPNNNDGRPDGTLYFQTV
jgi:hypothetical protein